MKQIINKKVTVKGTEVDYKKIIGSCIDNVDGQSGVTTSEIRERMRILNALDTAGDLIKLEDSDYNKLTQLVKGMKWAFVDLAFVQFEDDIMEAENTPV